MKRYEVPRLTFRLLPAKRIPATGRVAVWSFASLMLVGVANATDTDGDGIDDGDEGYLNGAPLNLINNRGFESPVVPGVDVELYDQSIVDGWSTTSACS